MALKILLADDSMTAQNMGKKILIDAGYDVVAVSNGAAAIKKIASDRPDIIILDVYMPGYTGLEVCERVKGASETSRTPVLLTVGKMEPFKPEEANRVRADGVMIKPFEATDLITAIQGIANKMTAGAPRHDPTVRIAAPMASLDHTILIAPPTHEDTVRIPTPRSAQATPAYEETLRLTPEQIRAFQDKSYKDWVASAEVEMEENSMPEDTPDEALFGTGVRELDPVPEEPVMAPSASILEPMESAVAEVEEEVDTPIMPGLDSTESHMARAMAGALAGNDFFTVSPSVQQETSAHQSNDAPAMYSGAEETAAEAPSQPFFTLPQHAEPIEVVPDVPVMMASPAPELETSAPVSPGPSFVEQLDELEPTVAPPIEVVAEAAPELEVNSPIFVRHEVEVTTDPALITSDDDMSQFVTKFGQEGAEEVHVGMASDLPPEQMAALMSPEPVEERAEIMQEVPVLDDPEIFVPRMVELHSPEPVVPEAVTLIEEEETLSEVHTAELHTVEAHNDAVNTNVLDEVGTIEPEAALTGTGPTIAYVPSIEDTQPITPYVDSTPEVEQSEALPEPEPVMAAAEPEADQEPESVFVVATVPVPEEVPAIAAEEHASMAHIIEAASAAVVGGGALTEAAHFFTVPEPEPVPEEHHVDSFMPAIEETHSGAPVEFSAEPLISDVPAVPEPFGDAALAEELAAALADKESEEQATVAADAAISSVTEPQITTTADPLNDGMVHTAEDSKLSQAVARALERLRPQIIAEILKEFTK